MLNGGDDEASDAAGDQTGGEDAAKKLEQIREAMGDVGKAARELARDVTQSMREMARELEEMGPAESTSV